MDSQQGGFGRGEDSRDRWDVLTSHPSRIAGGLSLVKGCRPEFVLDEGHLPGCPVPVEEQNKTRTLPKQ